MNTRLSPLKTSLGPLVWISRCIGQLPVIWNPSVSQWQVAPWCHPQSIYFLCLLLFRLLVYGTKSSYALLASPLQFSQSPTLAASFILECIYIWLRLVVAPYGLVFSLKRINKILQNLEKVDIILDLSGQTKPDKKMHKCTIFMVVEMIIAVSLMLTFANHFVTWYNLFIPSYHISQLVVTWYFLDIIMEVTVLIHFCTSSILVQQRIAMIREHLTQHNSNEALTTIKRPQNHLLLKQLPCAYVTLREVWKDICQSFGWTVLAISFRETMVLTKNSYGLARRLLGIALIKQKEILPEEYYFILTMICHAFFLLVCLFHYTDQIPDEMELTMLTYTTTHNSPELKKDLWDLHRAVSLNPFETITAAKFYDVGRRTIPAVLGVILTYFVVLIQFEGSERFGNHCHSNGSSSVYQ